MRLSVLIAAAVAAVAATAAEYSIKWHSNTVEVAGLSTTNVPAGARLFSVYADQGSLLTDVNLPEIAGSYAFKKGVLTFSPQFPFQPHVKYRAVLRTGEKVISSTHEIPAAKPQSTTTVAAIYPAVDVLPENVLKFYVLFSAPMSGGQIYEHIHLRNAAGEPVELPFLEIDEELWDRSMTRLTLFLDPGRIKRGVQPLEEIGPALQPGKSFTLTISRAWRDANGAPLKADFKKAFKVAAADREPPNPLRWKITAPKMKTRDAVTVAFDEPMDHALAQRVLRITDPAGASVAGTVKLDSTDQTWSFVPDNRWEKGTHKLVVPTIIEDLAGNNIGKPFDVDLEEKPRPVTTEVVGVSFTIR